MTINDVCRQYRLARKITLREVEGNPNVGTISAFENNRSGSIRHLIKYYQLAERLGDTEMFSQLVADAAINNC